MDKKRFVLVTGGAGFVGTHLCRRLVRDGFRVIVLDNYFTGSRDNHVEGVEYREGHTKDIARLVPEDVGMVFHLGEYSRVEKSLEDPPTLVWDLNIAGTFAVLEFCRTRHCKMLYAGSSTKFGDQGAARDLTPYTWMKAANTELVRNYGSWYGLSFAITYFYNVYGPGEISHGPYSTLIGIFSEEYRQGRPLTVVLPGTQKRNFTHVDDIVDGLMLVGEKGEGDEFGIGAEESYSVQEVAEMFGGDIVTLPPRKGNRMTSEVRGDKVRALGWKQRHTLSTFVQQFKKDVPRGVSVGQRILVFSTTFVPVIGPAETALLKLMRLMPQTQFDVVTTVFSPEALKTPSPLVNVTIHRVGYGSRLDKYLLPFLGAKKARALAAKTSYLFGWSIMASYAGLAGMLWRRSTSTPLLISLADQSFERLSWIYRLLLRVMLKRADQVSVATGAQERYASGQLSTQHLLANQQGDGFVNQVRFVYNALLKETMTKYE